METDGTRPDAVGEASATVVKQGMTKSDAITHAPIPMSLPTTLCRSYKILNISTDAWVQVFSDRIFAGVTQLNQKVGNYVMCQAVKSPIDHASVDFSISTVLGNREDPMMGVYARRITERLIQDRVLTDPISVFLGISLKDSGKEPKMFHYVVDVLYNLIREALQTKGMQ